MSQRDLIRQAVDDKCLATTREVLDERRRILRFARNGQGSRKPLAQDHVITRDWLSDEQISAITGLLSSSDRLQILRGVAGSGKTTMMRETIDAIEAGGKHVAVLAPTAEAAYDVLTEKEGFQGQTLAAFLTNEQEQATYKRGVLWVDEAGLVGSQDMARLVQVADALDARIILSGDARQHQSVARGKPLELLEKEAGIMPKEVKDIRRQTGEYKKAVTLLSDGHVAKALEKLDKLGFIHEIEDHQQRYSTLARDYADSLDRGKKALVVAPTHVERETVTAAIRSELKDRKVIRGPDHEIITLQSKRLTAAERQDPLNFQPGDVIEFITKGKGGFKAGDRLTVSEINKGNVIAESGSRPIEVPLASPNSFDVYRTVETPFAVGDMIRVTKNRRPDKKTGNKRINNGSLFQITGFDNDGSIMLDNGKVLPSDWGHFEHGVTVTSYGSQGKTFDEVFVAQSTMSFAASSPEQAYVSVSRVAKKCISIRIIRKP